MFTVQQLQNANDMGIHLAKFIGRVLDIKASTIHVRIHRGTKFTDDEKKKIIDAWEKIFPDWCAGGVGDSFPM